MSGDSIGYMFYPAITITCLCYNGTGPPPEGIYVYNTTNYPFYPVCETPAIEDPMRDLQQRPARYFTVILIGCVPRYNMTFAIPLYMLGMKPLTAFTVVIPPNAPTLTPWSFAGMSPYIHDLRLFSRHAIVVLEPGTLADFSSVRHLTLSKVRVDHLPKSLNSLYTEFTDYETLPPEAMNVLNLMGNETRLTRISGTATRLKEIWIDAPLTEIPKSRTVERVTLNRAAVTMIPAFGSMTDLTMIELRVTELHSDFLGGCLKLAVFKLLKSNFTKLPDAFFQDMRQLKEIDLSDNNFEAIPSMLILNLPKLETLRMSNNRLRTVSFDLPPEGPIRTLDLSGNPIGDHCLYYSHLETLKELTTLNLSRTDAKQVCAGLPHTLKHLKTLDLSHNPISEVPCSILRVERGSSEPPVTIDLTGSQIDVNCTAEDYLHLTQSKQRLRVIVIGERQCTCNGYWLMRMQRDFEAEPDTAPNITQCYIEMARPCRERMRCHEAAIQRCQIKSYGNNSDVFMVNDKEITIEYDEGNYFKASCSAADLEDKAWPAFPWNVRFNNVSLYGCRPPSKQYKYYSEALSIFKVTVGENFFLYDLPKDTILTGVPFSALPSLKLLHLEAAESEVLVIPKDVLPMIEPISEMHLVRVRSENVPTMLEYLNLTDTGITALPKGSHSALNLTIKEKLLTDLTGWSWRMEQLTVTAPVKTLMNAQVLKVLELTGAQLEANFTERYLHLETLKLHQLAMTQLPDNFLRGAGKLKIFELTHNNYRTVPADLFKFSPNLWSIDLSYNQLETLPKDLFAGLKDLQYVNLKHNRLNEESIPDLRFFPKLKNISLLGNLAL